MPVLHSLGRLRLRRTYASWVRLVLARLLSRGALSPDFAAFLAGRFSPPVLHAGSSLDFDSTLGFPGEGPHADHSSGLVAASLSFGCPFSSVLGLFLGPSWPCARSLRVEHHTFLRPTEFLALPFLISAFDATLGFPGEGWFFFRVFRALALVAMALAAPASKADQERASKRGSVLLVADRIVRPVTRSNRARLAEAFSDWLLQQRGVSLDALVNLPYDQIEQVSEALVAYGQFLNRTGQAYYKYSETINAVASLRPALRRTLTHAWDLAYAWLTEEPHIHHRALPKSVLLAVLSVALVWGWATEAALFGLAWAGLLRFGEIFTATRGDLVLPDDAAPGTDFILLQIKQPKTRGRAARHQAARVDPQDLVLLISSILGPLPRSAKLWPFSDGVLRRRLKTILHRLGLEHPGEKSVFDLASFRPGGATWMLHLTENPELVRRGGRWLSSRVMGIYLQEIVTTTFVPQLQGSVRTLIQQLAIGFPLVLKLALFLEASYIPRRAWYNLFAAQ